METTGVKSRPILFSGAMVRAILAGRKTQTRRVVTRSNSTASGYRERAFWDALDFNGQPCYADGNPLGPGGLGCGQYLHVPKPDDETVQRVRCDIRPGDELWVRETWHPFHRVLRDECGICYRAGGQREDERAADLDASPGWRPSIFMPRWASRLTLRVTGVRVERVQEIGDDDAAAEGVYHDFLPQIAEDFPNWAPIGNSGRAVVFRSLWDSINGKRAPWASNPWVWAITFERA